MKKKCVVFDSYDISANVSTTKAIQVAFLCNKVFCCCFERYSQIVFYIYYLISRWMFFIITLQETNGVLCICHVVYCSDICVERTSQYKYWIIYFSARYLFIFGNFIFVVVGRICEVFWKEIWFLICSHIIFDAMYYIQVWWFDSTAL